MTTGICALSILFVNSPTATIYIYMTILLNNLTLPVINAAAVESYSTSIRFALFNFFFLLISNI